MQKNLMADWNLDPTKQTNTDMKANWLNLDNGHLPHYLLSYWGRKIKGRKEVRNNSKDTGGVSRHRQQLLRRSKGRLESR